MNLPSLARIALTCIAPIALFGCASTPPIGQAPGIEVVQLDGLPAPTAPYAFEPLDKLNITVFGQQDLSGERQVGSDGSISFPLIGRVDTVGKTPGQLEDEIESRLRGRYLVEPSVSVTAAEAPSRLMFVGGQVNRSGSYPAINGMTLSRAVIVAGGRGEFAKTDDVLIQRNVGGQKYIGVYNIEAIERGNYEDPRVYPNDVILVGDSKGRRRLLEILSYVQLFTQPLIAIDRIGLGL